MPVVVPDSYTKDPAHTGNTDEHSGPTIESDINIIDMVTLVPTVVEIEQRTMGTTRHDRPSLVYEGPDYREVHPL